MQALEIEYLAIDAVLPYARNSRTHSASQITQIAASIKEFGFTNPILVDPDGVIIAGHGRLEGARKAGLKEVPCIRLGHLTESQRRALVIADNRIALNSGWDQDMLAVELDELRDVSFDLSMLGFAKQELNELIGTPNIPPADPADGLSETDYGGATSMTRTGAPIKFWKESGFLEGEVLDYGCGQEGHAFHKYDIVHHPDPGPLMRSYDAVMCNFVLNVQPVDHLITQIIVMLWHLTKPGGTVLIAVRNDVKETGKTSRGFQVRKEPGEWKEMVCAVLGERVEMVERPSFTGFIHRKADA